MITGELKSRIDRIWDASWSGGISNPLEVTEQISYLLFIRRLDDLQTLAEKKADRTGRGIENPVVQPGRADLRWSRFKDLEPGVMHRSSAIRSSRAFLRIDTRRGEPEPPGQQIKKGSLHELHP